MDYKEQQEEEIEVLRSIYDGDESFKEIGPTTYQYKYGEENSYKSLVVELVWGDTYPETPPTVNMDTFYNKHIIDSVKTKIVEGVLEQAQDFLDTAMSYSLFEWVKENYDDLIADQPDSMPVASSKNEEKSEQAEVESSKKKEKKEQLTKHQKRRLYEKTGNATGEKQRGYNWIDVVKHLSQTGSAES